MAKRTVAVPDDFREFMRTVAETLDSAGEDTFLDAADALQAERVIGGRVDGKDTFEFVYSPAGGEERWTVRLKAREIRDIAAGQLPRVSPAVAAAEPKPPVRRRRTAKIAVVAPAAGAAEGPPGPDADLSSDLAWARRLLDVLGQAELIELDDAPAATRALAGLLGRRGEVALSSLEEAEELAEAMADLAGVGEIYASAEEVRRALRATWK